MDDLFFVQNSIWNCSLIKKNIISNIETGISAAQKTLKIVSLTKNMSSWLNNGRRILVKSKTALKMTNQTIQP